MAQSLTIKVPHCWFKPQEKFTVTFECSTAIPFTCNVSKDGICRITDFHDVSQIEEWIKKGLKVGLRIIAINEETFNETIDGAGDDIGVLTNDRIRQIIHQCGNNEIEFTLIEEVSSFDDDKSQPLGLEYYTNDHKEDEKDNYLYINGIRMTASSFRDDDHHQIECRLNNPQSFWSPSIEDEKSGTSWISLDLGCKKYVDMMCIQGDHDHKQYVRKCWIDYSDDGCQWKCHSMKQIKLKYIEPNSSNEMINDNISSPKNLDFQITSVIDIGDKNHSQSHMAVVKIWPPLFSQFIRIRPVEWRNHIAMRLELFGTDKPLNYPKKIVTKETVHPQYIDQLNAAIKQKSNRKISNNKIIQIDCKSVIVNAMEQAGCTSYRIYNDENSYWFTATAQDSNTCDAIIGELTKEGVSNEMGEITVTPIEWHKSAEKGIPKKSNGRTGFYASIKKRKTKAIVKERIVNNAKFNFDYGCFLTIASLIAVGGLATNSAVIVVASMLVSPIMGPVLAATFGAADCNYQMFKFGVKNELFSLFVCIIIGLIAGGIQSTWNENANEWPTQEMTSRGHPLSLAVGAFIAFVSGIGVALSVMVENVSSLVGVAISASLLPPAVNCGMLIANRMFVMAGFSLALTVENIFIIFISAFLTFLIKDIRPKHFKRLSHLYLKRRHGARDIFAGITESDPNIINHDNDNGNGNGICLCCCCCDKHNYGDESIDAVNQRVEDDMMLPSTNESIAECGAIMYGEKKRQNNKKHEQKRYEKIIVEVEEDYDGQ